MANSLSHCFELRLKLVKPWKALGENSVCHHSQSIM